MLICLSTPFHVFQAEILTGWKVETLEHAQEALPVLLARGCHVVIITLGEKGAVYATRENPTSTVHVPAPKVKATDTTVRVFCSGDNVRVLNSRKMKLETECAEFG